MDDTGAAKMRTPPRPPKRKRLNFACNYCRARKTRCDERKPSCHSCLAAGVRCVTTDKRRPGANVERRTAGSPRQRPAVVYDDSPVEDDHHFSLGGEGDGASPPIPAHRAPLADRRTSTATTTALSEYSAEPDPLTPGSGRGTDTESLDPPAEDAAGRYAGLLPIIPRLRGSNTLEVLTAWLDLAFYRLGLSPLQQFGGPSGLEGGNKVSSPLSDVGASVGVGIGGGASIALSLVVPGLPPPAECERAIASYFGEIHPIFPVLDVGATRAACRAAAASGPEALMQAGDLLPLLQLYLVLVMGSSTSSTVAAARGRPPDGDGGRGATYIKFCKTMLGHILPVRTLEAVQCIFLLALALWLGDQIAASWPVTTLCVSMAQAVGIHRRPPLAGRNRGPLAANGPLPSEGDVEGEVRRQRTWWSIYAFEKLFAFEFGRQSSIRDAECNQPEPVATSSPSFAWSFRILTGFARLLSQINEAGIRIRIREEQASESAIEAVIGDKIRLTGETVHMLMQWADSVPERLRPRSDLICSREEFPLASFISIHYNNALMMLSRNSFLISDTAIRFAVERHAKGQPWSSIIQNGQTAAANSARTIIRLLIDGHELDTPPALLNLATSLHALYVLAVRTLTHPSSRMANSDLILLHNAAEFAEEQYSKFHKDQNLQTVVRSLTDQVARTVQIAQGKSGERRNRTAVVGGFNGMNPASSSLAPGGNPAPALPGLGGSASTAVAGSGDVTMGDVGAVAFHDIAWYPALADEIGWDWGDFSQLFEPNFSDMAVGN